ncbi:hypothetical protein [Blastomonas sp. AAP53]|uniref:hypothetical protein n=1 Tax=Blastomonas sp. AAP53 TaxID=1248760 RepID=UPI0002E638DB|nr:hypothetical protein [Blastomonas sp. AAP53]
MVDDADDNHDTTFNDIEYSMPTMHQAANAGAKLGLGYAYMGVLCEAIESVVKTQKIRIGCVRTEVFKTEETNFNQVLPRLWADIQFSHDLRGTQS